MSRRNSAIALDLKRAYVGLARFAPLSTSSAFRQWREHAHLLRDVYNDLTHIEQERPGVLDELLIDATETAVERMPPEVSLLIARYVGRIEAPR